MKTTIQECVACVLLGLTRCGLHRDLQARQTLVHLLGTRRQAEEYSNGKVWNTAAVGRTNATDQSLNGFKTLCSKQMNCARRSERDRVGFSRFSNGENRKYTVSCLGFHFGKSVGKKYSRTLLNTESENEMQVTILSQTPRSRDFLEKLIVAQLLKKFLTIYETECSLLCQKESATDSYPKAS
jgi:hypothetical protein